jgi:hypothetical protein
MKNLAAFLMILCLAAFVVGCGADDASSPSAPSPVGGADEAASDDTATRADDAAAAKKEDDAGKEKSN